MIRLAGALLMVAASAGAQTAIIGDGWITQTLAVGTTEHAARLNVRMGGSDSAVFQISGVDLTPFLVVSTNNRMGFGVTPTANVDLYGTGDSGSAGLELKQGSLYPNAGGAQITFAQNGATDRRHSIRTVHLSSTARNSIDFLLWTPAQSVSSLGTLQVASLVTTTMSASVHVMPTSELPDVELEVSDGSTTGGGAVHRLAEATHSSRELKADIEYLGAEDEARAARDVATLRHARFRYKSWRRGQLVEDRKAPWRNGLIYEEAPESIRGPAETIVIDRRVANAELALKDVMRRLEGLEARVK